MRVDIEFHDFLDDEITESLWSQNICMDDWDYLLFIDIKYDDDFLILDDPNEAQPKNYYVNHLLRGCCSNKWYPVNNFIGRKGYLGIAYHA